jgi:hypothetical protein
MTTTTAPLHAYHGDSELKDQTVAKARMHREAGSLVKDVYASEGKVCAVGCLTEDPNGGHYLYPEKWGIPTWMAYLEEKVFVGLPDEKAMLWPERFLSAIPAGADWDGLADRLAIQRLKEECLPLSGTWPESVRAEVVAAVEKCIAALEGKGDRSAARSAAWSARSAAAYSAARSAYSAAWSAYSAAWSARSAESAAWSARSAESAAESAAAWSARSAAWSAAYEREAGRIIAELEALPVLETAR